MPDAKLPRILLVTRNLPPLVGGMERLNWHMAAELGGAAEIRIVGPKGSAALAPKGVDVCEVPLKPLWKFLLAAAYLSRREAKCWRPDIVLAGSGLTAPLVRLAARACDARAAVYVHGLDVAVRHPVYRTLWLSAIRRMDCVIANSRATAGLCRDVGVDSVRISIVHPGVDLPTTREDRLGELAPPRFELSVDASIARTVSLPFRELHRLGNRPLLLSVGRLSTRKGLREFVSLALPRIVALHTDAILVVIGDAPAQALHAQTQTRESIQAAANAAGVGSNLLFLGTITDYTQLGAVYREGDVHVFPVRDLPGDPEGFGMVAVEAAAHGMPTVAFATGGVVDAVGEGRSGYLVSSGDYIGFADAVLKLLAARSMFRESCEVFARRFAWSEFGRKMRDVLGITEQAKGLDR